MKRRAKKYELNKAVSNKYAAWQSNPTVAYDGETEMGVPVQSEENIEASKQHGEQQEL